MPQTTPERSARWPGGDAEAIGYLRAGGWVLHKSWEWSHPNARDLTEREQDAVTYLVEEWDFGGVIDHPAAEAPSAPAA
jgi:hypothetical protein